MLKKLIKGIRKGRRSRLIVFAAIILIVAPLAINTLLNINSQTVKADSFFKFDEGYGTSSAVNDVNGSVSAGSITNAVWRTEDLCKSGKCLYFDGTGDYVSFGDEANFDFAAPIDFTIEFWFRTGDITSGTRIFVSKYRGNDAEGGYKVYMSSDGKVNFGIDDDNSGFPEDVATSINAYDDNKWHHVSAVKDGTTSLTLYIDSLKVADDQTISSTGTLVNNDPFTLGMDADLSSNAYTGFLDELRVFTNSARSESEVKTDYLGSASTAKDSGLVAYWDFNENTGTTAYDKSGNGNDSTAFNNQVTWATGKYGSGTTYDGTDDYITIGNTTTIDYLPQMTISFWINVNSIDTFDLLDKSGGDGTGWQIILNTAKYAFSVDSDGTSLDCTGPAMSSYYGVWKHVSFTWDGTSTCTGVKLYLDGVLQTFSGTQSMTGNRDNDTGNNLLIGSNTFGTDFNGVFDELKIYNYIRTPTQIVQDMNQDPPSGISASFGPNQSFLSDGLVGYWKMDETALNGCAGGEDSCDLSGNDIHGTWEATMDTTNIVGGKFGKSVEFDGSTDKIDLGTTSKLINHSQITIAAWIYPHTAGQSSTGEIYSSDQVDSNLEFKLNSSTSTNALHFQRGYSTTYLQSKSADNTITMNQWQHVVVTWNGGMDSSESVKLFVNGQEVAYQTQTDAGGTIIPENGNQKIGIKNDGGTTRAFDGLIDEFRYYNRALSPAEVADLYHWAPGPVGYWKMDEGSWNGTAAEVKDSSGNNLNGTSNGDANTTSGKFGKAGSFDGTEDYISVSDPGANSFLDFGSGSSITISSWVKPSAFTDYQGIVTKSDPDYNYVFQLGDGSDTQKLRFVFFSSDSEVRFESTNDVFSLNTWAHVAVSHTYGNENSTKLYVNGVNISGSWTVGVGNETPDQGNAPLVIGQAGPVSEDFIGFIDDVKIYNYARTPAQIIQDMNAGHPAPGSPVGSALGHWKFDEGYGDNAYDSGTGGNNGNLGGATSCPQSGDSACPTWTNSGKFGKALSFDTSGTTDDYLVVPDDSALTFDDQITISAWFNSSSDNGGWDTILHGNNDGLDDLNSYWLEVYENGDEVGCGIYNTSIDTHSESFVFSPNEWHHLACTYDGTTAKIFADGKELGRWQTTGNITNDSGLTIGGISSGDFYFDGLIDEVKIYNFALTETQVKAEYNQGKAVVFGAKSTDSSGNASWSANDAYCPPGQGSACTPPVGEWKLDENTGQAAYDTSGNGNTGTLGSSSGIDTSDPQWSPSKFGTGLKFDGSNDYVNVGNGSTINDLPTADFTVSFWEKFNSQGAASFPSMLGKRNSLGSIGWQIYTETSIKYIWFAVDYPGGTTASYRSASNAFSDNQWANIAVVWTSATKSAKIYINGAEVTYTTQTPGSGTYTSDASEDLLLGFALAGGRFKGDMDNFRLYNYARTPAQIAWEYNQGAPVAWYKFNECSGATAYNSALNGNGDAAGMNGTIYSLTGNNVGSCGGTAGDMWGDGATGKYGASLAFDGTDDYVDLGDNLDCNSTTGFTVSAWYKWLSDPALDGDAIISRFNGSSDKDWWLKNDSWGVYFGIADTTTTSTAIYANTPIVQGEWQHGVGRWDPSTGEMRLFINGKKQTAYKTISSCLSTGNNSAYIGSQPIAGSEVNAQIDEVKFWYYPLTDEQINMEYNDGKAVKF